MVTAYIDHPLYIQFQVFGVTQQDEYMHILLYIHVYKSTCVSGNSNM